MGIEITFLGETTVAIEDSPFKDYTLGDWVLEYIMRYGGIDGDHHKIWVLDQAVRILHNTPILLSLAKWDDGQEEYRFWTGEPTESYLQWVVEMKAGEDGPNTYGYDEGIAP